MTNEEAIQVLDKLRVVTALIGQDPKALPALDVAIAALKGREMTNEQALGILTELRRHVPHAGAWFITEAQLAAVDVAVRVLAGLPAARGR